MTRLSQLYTALCELVVLKAGLLLATDSWFAFEAVVLGITDGLRVTMPYLLFLDFQATFGPTPLFLSPFNEFPRVTNKIFYENAAAK